MDGVLEDIRLQLEVVDPKFNQRRISVAKFLGELYNYRLIDSGVIFKVLYLFISFGVVPPEEQFEMLQQGKNRSFVLCLYFTWEGLGVERSLSYTKEFTNFYFLLQAT